MVPGIVERVYAGVGQTSGSSRDQRERSPGYEMSEVKTILLSNSRPIAAQLFCTLLCWISLQAAAPTPQSHFGHPIGQDRSSLEWSKVVSYFNLLAKSSDRVRIVEYGKSTLGRPMIAAIISSPANLKRLDRLQAIQHQLADPRRTSEAEALKLISEGKTVVLITCSVHSTEVASTHTAVEFGYRMATENRAKVNTILDNVVILLAPSINPDGVDIVTNWYRKTLGTPFEGTSPPELYQKYVGHDNNRDWYIFSQAETRAVVSQLHNRWHPQIVYDVHQQGANASRMFLPPWLDPIEPNVDPVIAQQSNMLGMTMATDLMAAGRKGVVVNAIYDFWTPARHYQSYHGGIRVLSESASARLSTPVTVRPEQITPTAQGYNPRERSWNYLEPWLGGEWRLRDIIDDQLICFESLLYTAAARREEFLRNFYRVNKRNSERRDPYAFVISSQQRDPDATRRLLETLRFGDVEIESAREAFQIGTRQYPAGSYVVRMQQPFSGFAKTLLERQQYPDLRLYPGGPPRRPYDVTAHTLPLLMGVEVDIAVDQFPANLAPAAAFKVGYSGEAPRRALPASDGASWRRVNDAWRSGIPVWRNLASGDFFVGASKPASAEPLKQPRIALYKSHQPSMDEGWTRWILEQFGWVYESAPNAVIRAGSLRAKYDVIVFPDQSANSIHEGYRQGQMPEPYIGGLGREGAEALRRFAEEGGRLVFLNDSTEYALEHLNLPVRNILQGISNREFYCPGSLLNVRLEPGSPLGLGLPSEFTIWNEQSPVWELEESAKAVLRYSQSPVLASGWLLGEGYLAGKPALADVPVGSGRVILFGMRPQYRGQSYLTLKLLFNALVM